METITLYDLTPPGPMWFEQAADDDSPLPPEPTGWVLMEQWGGTAQWWREEVVRAAPTRERKSPGG